MRVLASRFAAAFLSAAVLAACGGNSVPSASAPTSDAGRQSAIAGRVPKGVTEKVLYNFGGGSDGFYPTNVTLIAQAGGFYGVTRDGGGSGCQSGNGCGTVFSTGPSGVESVLYRFKGGTTDGSAPHGGLISKDGVFYGQTEFGGKYGGGTFFKITGAGKETVLHSFGGGSGSGADGVYPYGDPIVVNNVFYGTTLGGGAACSSSGGCGIVYSITSSGAESVLHSFAGGHDGNFPSGRLLDIDDELYGTTELGGNDKGSLCGNSSAAGCGIIFRVSRSGIEKVLYAFTGGSDGAAPSGGLIDVNGALYGMAKLGGSGCTYSGGCGTVFRISTSGAYHLVYSFAGPPNDGAIPFANLTYVEGVLYGTTQEGGSSTACSTSGLPGCGAAFRVTTSGSERMIYSFKGPPDGALPITTLVNLHNTLYGTTHSGGSGSCANGCGTVFSLSGL